MPIYAQIWTQDGSIDNRTVHGELVCNRPTDDQMEKETSKEEEKQK